MLRYTARRLLQFIPVFFGATFLVFAMTFALPGDPIRALSGDRPLPAATIQTLRERYHLNDPLPVQYGKYIVNVFQGDFGETFRGRAVGDIMAETFPVTLRLAMTAFALEIVIGLAAGVLAALRQGSFLDSLVLLSTTAAAAVPVFVLGYSAQLLFGVRLGWLPVAWTAADGWLAYALPGLVLAALQLAYLARLTRTSLVEHLRADYIRAASAKGLTRRRVVGRHALRNSLIPVVTLVGTDLGTLMSGAVITEGIFNVPGVGREVFRAVIAQENTVVVGIVTALVMVFMISTLLVDLLYAALDPRIRYG